MKTRLLRALAAAALCSIASQATAAIVDATHSAVLSFDYPPATDVGRVGVQFFGTIGTMSASDTYEIKLYDDSNTLTGELGPYSFPAFGGGAPFNFGYGLLPITSSSGYYVFLGVRDRGI
jgi:hypothetical protein